MFLGVLLRTITTMQYKRISRFKHNRRAYARANTNRTQVQKAKKIEKKYARRTEQTTVVFERNRGRGKRFIDVSVQNDEPAKMPVGL